MYCALSTGWPVLMKAAFEYLNTKYYVLCISKSSLFHLSVFITSWAMLSGISGTY